MRLRSAGAAVLLIALGCASAAAQTAAGKREYITNEISGFSVVLVVGETERGRSSTENLPEAAARALKDMREFLPYKSFRALDAQWTSCCVPKPTTTVSGRLQGVVEFTGSSGKVVQTLQKYAFSIAASSSLTNIPVRFVLSVDDPPGRRAAQGQERETEREQQDLKAEIETLEAQIGDMQRRVETGVVLPIEVRPLMDRHASLQRRLADLTADAEAATHGGRAIMDSSFTMNAGETVVVGTSKLGGDKALIAVVTAVRKTGAAR